MHLRIAVFAFGQFTCKIWEAVLVETMERAALLLSPQLNRSPSCSRERTEWRERTLALAERAAVVSGLQLVQFVDF